MNAATLYALNSHFQVVNINWKVVSKHETYFTAEHSLDL